MIPRSYRQEAISLAYVRAVAAAAGCTCTEPHRDFGIDLYLPEIQEVAGRFRDTGDGQIDVQLRSTTVAHVGPDFVTHDLDVRTYNLLRGGGGMLRVLVLVVLPESEGDWFAQTVDALSLRRCAYWLQLSGMPETSAESTIRVRIPTANVFSPDAVALLFAQSREGA